MIECQVIDGKIRITTDDANAEAVKLADALEGSEWEAAYNATKMVDGLIVFEPVGLDPDDVDDESSTTSRFIEIVCIEPGDRMEHGQYDPEAG